MKKIILSLCILVCGLMASCSSNTDGLEYAKTQCGDAGKATTLKGTATSKDLNALAKKLYPQVKFPRDFTVTGYLTKVDTADYWYFVYAYKDSTLMAKKFDAKKFKMSAMFSPTVWDSTKAAITKINPSIEFDKKKK